MMKVLVSVALLAAVVVAQPQRYSQQNQQIDNQQQQRYYIARQEEASAADAPYPASGWRPAGRVFSLPQRQFAAVQQSQQQYGAPAAPQPQGQYGTPQQQYGAPEQPAATTETPDNTDDEEEVSTVQSISSSETEPASGSAEAEDEEQQSQEQQPQQSGEYYVALPDGRLQRVRYVSRQDVEAMKYFAKIRAENVEPLRGPIYAYAPLQRLEIVPGGLQVSVAPIAADAKPQKLAIEPVAAQVQYQRDNPARVVPLTAGNPLNAAPYATYTANYQTPVAGESRFILAFQ